MDDRRRFIYSPDHDIYDGAPWTESSIQDLRAVIENGGSIEDAAVLICRQGSIDDVRAKAIELGLVPQNAKSSGIPKGTPER